MRSRFTLIRRKSSRRWRDMAQRRTVVAAEGFRIHTAEFGAGEPLVLLHGLSGSARWWKRNIPALEKHFRVLVPDLIGFGRTRHRGPLPGIPRTAEILAAWVEAMSLERIRLVGHSMGGQLALHLAASRPELIDRLVLVDSAGVPRPLTPRALLRSAIGLAPPRRWGDPTFIPIMAGDALFAGPRSITGAIRHILADDVRPLLERIRAPTLVIWGERDTLVPLEHARVLAAAIPGAEMMILPGAAHNPMVDRPAEFNALLLAFLQGDRPA